MQSDADRRLDDAIAHRRKAIPEPFATVPLMIESIAWGYGSGVDRHVRSATLCELRDRLDAEGEQ